MKNYNTMTKLANEEVTQIAYLDKRQIRKFYNHLIASN